MDSQVMVALALSLVGGLSTSLGFFLNPRFQYQEGFEYNDSIRSGVTKVIERLAPNVTFAIEATREIAQFRGKIGRFGDLTAQTAVGIMNPGALFVILSQAPNLRMLGLLQGFAAGLMLSISFFDLAHNAMNSIGFLKGNLWFFAGVIFFAFVASFIPEPSLVPNSNRKSNQKEDDGAGKDLMKKHRRQVLFSGIVTAIVAGISLHNFPEGMAVFLGSMKGLRVGVNLALAIALHNIPEGVAVALPVYFATESKWQAFKLATLSGFAEPLGVVVVAYMFPSSLSPEILEGLLGSVGGVMAFLTLHEMLPLAFDYAGHKQAVKAVFLGMAAMSASLYFLESSLPKEMSF